MARPSSASPRAGEQVAPVRQRFRRFDPQQQRRSDRKTKRPTRAGCPIARGSREPAPTLTPLIGGRGRTCRAGDSAPRREAGCDTQRAAQALMRAEPDPASGKQRAAFGHSAERVDRQPLRKHGAPIRLTAPANEEQQLASWSRPAYAPQRIDERLHWPFGAEPYTRKQPVVDVITGPPGGHHGA
jgi:hypothetical protein